MKRPVRYLVLSIAGVLAGSVTPAAVAADAYPVRPVRMIVPFAPGGASDFIARIIQPKLSDELGGRIVVDNRSGAAGNIGVEIAARATPDGYTLILGNIGTMAINPGIYSKFPIKPTRDLIPITLVADVPGAFGVHPSVPVATAQEFVAHAKARPGQLHYGSAGVTSAQRLLFEVFMKKAGIRLNHIPYKEGAGGATLALLSGEVSASIATVASYIPHVKTGKLRAVAVIAPGRVRQLPDVATMAEQGYPDWTLGSWSGVLVPVGTPKPIVDRIFAATARTMSAPDVAERINAGGAAVFVSKSPVEFAQFLKAQTDLWAQTIKDIGATAE